MHHKRAPSQHISLGKPGSEVDLKIDTGADISVISENTFSSLKFKPKLSNVNANFESPGGKLHCVLYTTTVKDKQFRMMLFVVAGPTVNNLLV